MTIQETMTQLQNNDLNEFVEGYQECFDQIDEIILELRMNNYTDEKAYAGAQTQLTGLYGTLITVYKMSEANKINMEAKTFVRLNAEYEAANPGGKPLSAAKLEKLTNIEIGDLRMLRNIFEGYVMAAEKGIITCQSNLKNMKQERIYDASNPMSRT